jgi:hypothetical protein
MSYRRRTAQIVPPTVIVPLNVGADVRKRVAEDASFSVKLGHGISMPVLVLTPNRTR